jgi:hypothetical protein
MPRGRWCERRSTKEQAVTLMQDLAGARLERSEL